MVLMQPRCTSKVSQVSDCQDFKLTMAESRASYAGGKMTTNFGLGF